MPKNVTAVVGVLELDVAEAKGSFRAFGPGLAVLSVMKKLVLLTLLLTTQLLSAEELIGLPPVVILAENHLSAEHKRLEQDFFNLAKVKSGYDCLFLEVGANFNQALAAYGRSEASYSNTIVSEISRTQNSLGLPMRNNWSEEVLAAARASGLKLYAVEFDYLTNYAYELFHQPDLYRHIVERNAWMARNIGQLLSSGTCHRGILIVGSDHVQPWRGDAALSVQAFLKKLEIESQVIDFENGSSVEPVLTPLDI